MWVNEGHNARHRTYMATDEDSHTQMKPNELAGRSMRAQLQQQHLPRRRVATEA